jgi:hypothetical protein
MPNCLRAERCAAQISIRWQNFGRLALLRHCSVGTGWKHRLAHRNSSHQSPAFSLSRVLCRADLSLELDSSQSQQLDPIRVLSRNFTMQASRPKRTPPKLRVKIWRSWRSLLGVSHHDTSSRGWPRGLFWSREVGARRRYKKLAFPTQEP